MKKLFLTNSLLCCILILWECNRIDLPVRDNNILCPVKYPALLGIDRYSNELSAEDAITVASMYLNKDLKNTKSSVTSVVPILDKKGSEQLYAVNYGDGFLLIPTSKAFVPIAAVCNGTYDASLIIPQEQLLIEEMCERIAANQASGDYEKYKDVWSFYEKKYNALTSSPLTRATNPDEACQEMSDEWDGLDVYYLCDASSLPSDIYQSFYATVQQEYQNSTIVYPDYSVITVDSTPVSDERGPYTKTGWGQSFPFNSAVPGGYRLGCLTVAVGQLMRSYGLPAGITWGAMPDSTSNTFLSNYLANLRASLQIDTNGTGYLSHAVTYINSQPYNCYSTSHNQASVISSINSKRPLIMYGRREAADTTYGHFWICDGHRSLIPKMVYSLYVLVPYGNNVEYYKIREEEVFPYNGNVVLDYFRMNWGWYGNHDGYYFEESVQPTTGYNYHLNRMDVFITNRQALYY